MQLCIDFGGTDIKLGLVRDGVVLVSTSLPVSAARADLDRAAAAADALLAEAREAPSAVGIAVPGVVDRDASRMLHANDKYDFLVAESLDLRAWAADRFECPAIVENDARAALAGEVSAGCAVGQRDVVLVTLGTGIGTAALIDGALVRGAHGHAGILGGHVTVDVDGARCPCGNLGCAEERASTRTLRRTFPDLSGMDALVTAARAGSVEHERVLDDYLRVWGATVVTMCHMYDPDLVVLSGGVLRAGDIVADPLRDYVSTHLWPSAHRPDVVVAPAPELSVLRGLAALAADLAIPTTTTSRTQEDAP